MRIFVKTNAGISEVTKNLGSYKSGIELATLTSADYVYLATDFPLNHFYVKMGTVVNAETVSIGINYWTGDKWQVAVNVNDYTDGFSNSGFIEFTPEKQVSWGREDTSSGGQSITGLETITVYDKYWTRLSFDADLTSAIEIEWIGNLFSSDEDLFAEYPIFNSSNFLTAFESGKTSWEEQHVKAAELMVQDMKRRGVICGPEQILSREILAPAAASKCAEIIFNAFGNDYDSQRLRARDEYDKRSDLSKYSVDKNNNAILEAKEVSYSEGWLSR